jgi:hypothetical protein
MAITVTRVNGNHRDGIDVETEIFSHHALIHINDVNVEICLSDWYGRRFHDEAIKGIDGLIALLTEAKTQIALHRYALPDGEE